MAHLVEIRNRGIGIAQDSPETPFECLAGMGAPAHGGAVGIQGIASQGEGRGFVLMPSACPYGRQLSPLALANYRKIIEVVDRWRGG